MQKGVQFFLLIVLDFLSGWRFEEIYIAFRDRNVSFEDIIRDEIGTCCIPEVTGMSIHFPDPHRGAPNIEETW